MYSDVRAPLTNCARYRDVFLYLYKATTTVVIQIGSGDVPVYMQPWFIVNERLVCLFNWKLVLYYTLEE